MFVFCVIVSACCCIYTAAWFFTGQRQREADQALANRFQITTHQSTRKINNGTETGDGADGESLNPFGGLLALNSDIVGWIKIDGTNINYPIVQSGDNIYYLSHDLNKEPNKHGAIFLDYRCEEDGDKIIYGHHMKDGTMFHNLTWYKNEAFRKNHDRILIYNIQGICESYRIIDVLYRAPSFSQQELSLYDYLRQLKDDYPERPLLYLTTCDGPAADARLIVVAGKEPADR